jgi:hypothetical protein
MMKASAIPIAEASKKISNVVQIYVMPSTHMMKASAIPIAEASEDLTQIF